MLAVHRDDARSAPLRIDARNDDRHPLERRLDRPIPAVQLLLGPEVLDEPPTGPNEQPGLGGPRINLRFQSPDVLGRHRARYASEHRTCGVICPPPRFPQFARLEAKWRRRARPPARRGYHDVTSCQQPPDDILVFDVGRPTESMNVNDGPSGVSWSSIETAYRLDGPVVAPHGPMMKSTFAP